jgi:hypothetical protein
MADTSTSREMVDALAFGKGRDAVRPGKISTACGASNKGLARSVVASCAVVGIAIRVRR